MKDQNPPGETAASQRPRSPRVPVAFDLTVEGTDTAGTPFSVKAQATKISRGGATIALESRVDITLGSKISLVPPFGGTLEAEVNGAWDDELDNRRRIGVKLLSDEGWFGE
ncbi:MAG TPA: PilZ domain-containing protein [Pyrinomonadaceae bacterium]|nr:PilZ domain-containing protein [Pyrinomonadaceae bacterium]